MSNKDGNLTKNEKKIIGGGSATVGGAALAKNQFDKGHITGRETLFHGTAKKNFAAIKDKGVLSSFADDPNNLTNTVLGESGKINKADISGKTYFARKRSIADGVNNSSAIHAARKKNGIFASPFDIIKDVQAEKKKRGILKVKAPTWKMKQVTNPELRGAKSKKEFANLLREDSGVALPRINKAVDGMVDAQLGAAYNSLGPKGTAVIQGDMSAEYIKGSKHYQRNSLKEVGSYIKANPKRFTKGVGKVGLGLAVAGVGAKITSDAVKKHRQEKTAAAISNMRAISKGFTEGIKSGTVNAKNIHALNRAQAKLKGTNSVIKRLQLKNSDLVKSNETLKSGIKAWKGVGVAGAATGVAGVGYGVHQKVQN